MTKISQLSSIGDSLAINDQFIIRDVSDVSTPNKSVTISGITRALDLGSAAAPAIAFASDKNSGLYSPGADQVAISTNGTGRLFVDSTGLVGVGTSAPEQKFEIAESGMFSRSLVFQTSTSNDCYITAKATGASASLNTNLNLRADGTTVNGTMIFSRGLNRTYTESARIDSSGRLGIGTSSPVEKLSFGPIGGSANSSIHFPTGNTNAYITGIYSANDYLSIASNFRRTSSSGGTVDSSALGTAEIGIINAGSSSHAITFGIGAANTVPSERVRIDSSGRVGIGTTSPAALLTVALPAATSATVATFSSPSYENVYIAAGNGGTACGIGTVSTSNFNIYTNSSPRMTVDSSGRLLVGTSSAGSVLTKTIELAGNSGLAQPCYQVYAYTGANDINCGYFQFYKSRGATVGTNTIVASGDTLGQFYWYGANGTGYDIAASIKAEVDGTPGAGDMPGRLVFSTTADGASSPTERMRIDSTGLMTLAGPGIKFPATQVASADPNTLDDYEEGTWTPNVGGNATYSKQEGSYTKVGRMVTVRFDMAITTIGTGSTTFISGLPFGVGSAATSEGYGATGYFASLAVNVTTLSCYSVASASNIGFNSIAAAGATASNNTAIFGNSARVQGSVTYFV